MSDDEPTLPPQDPDPPPVDPVQTRNLSIAATASYQRSLYRGNERRISACKNEVNNLLESRPGVLASFEPAMRTVISGGGRTSVTSKTIPDVNPDGTPRFMLVMRDPETKLRLTINPHQPERPYVLSQDSGDSLAKTDPANTPVEVTRFNDATRSGQSMHDILQNDPSAAGLIDRTLNQAITAHGQNLIHNPVTAQDIEGKVKIGATIADSLGLARQITGKVLTAFALKDVLQELADGRPVQAVLSAMNLMPGVGTILSETAQFAAYKAGLDVNPSIIQTVADLASINSLGPVEDFNQQAVCGHTPRPVTKVAAAPPAPEKVDLSLLNEPASSALPPEGDSSRPTIPPTPN